MNGSIREKYVVDDDNVLILAAANAESYITSDAAMTSTTVLTQPVGKIFRPTVVLPINVQKQLNIQFNPGEEIYILTKTGTNPLVELSFAPSSAVFLT